MNPDAVLLVVVGSMAAALVLAFARVSAQLKVMDFEDASRAAVRREIRQIEIHRPHHIVEGTPHDRT